MHAIALRRIVDIARAQSDVDAAERLLREGWPKLYRWHEWLVRHRDPHGSGMLAIVHGWESGMDNSPRWDLPYAAVVPGRRPAAVRPAGPGSGRRGRGTPERRASTTGTCG